jgi:hypothetical protein
MEKFLITLAAIALGASKTNERCFGAFEQISHENQRHLARAVRPYA